jgi:pyruvate ferredoxin oxidoreductase gamma subunit/2-oxoisovalerate ferredoxin oxidoreductase gamma subunit
MIEIRFHGRGGQGAVVGSKILASAAADEGFYVQTFPTFGVERRGAPVAAYLRIDSSYIYIRSAMYTADHVIVLDPSLLAHINVTDGQRESGFLILNIPDAKLIPDKLRQRKNLAVIDASGIAVERKLGTRTSPIVNTAILGAVIAVTKVVSFNSLVKTIEKVIPDKAQVNISAAQSAYDNVKIIG